MTGCWDPEFKPSVEEIVDYPMILWRFSQFAFFSERALWGDFPIQSSTWHAGGGHVRVNRLKPRAPLYTYTEHAQFVNVSYGIVV